MVADSGKIAQPSRDPGASLLKTVARFARLSPKPLGNRAKNAKTIRKTTPKTAKALN
jgi:hypothetical protein